MGRGWENGIQYRDVTLGRDAVNEQQRSIEVAFSSEAPVVRWWGIELLSHAPGAMRLDRLADGGPFLVNHNPDDMVGVVEQCRCDDDRIGRAVVRFSRSARADEIFSDIIDGIRRKISVGYRVHDVRELAGDQLPPELAQMAKREKLPVMLATDWEPLEISTVPIPADLSVGVGRSTGPGAGVAARAVELNSPGRANALARVRAGDVDRTSGWSFSAEDGNAILGEPPDWARYAKWHLAIDTSEPEETKAHYKYPFGKNGKVYRSGVIAAKQRAAQQGATAIAEAADEILQEIDKNAEKKATDVAAPGKERAMTMDSKTVLEVEAEIEKERKRAMAEATERERQRLDEIYRLAAKFQLPQRLVEAAVAEGTTIEQFRGLVLDRMGRDVKPLDTPLGELGMTSREVRQYSILRAIRAALSHDWHGAELEKEASDAIAKRVGQEARAFYLPYDVLVAKRAFDPAFTRDLNVGTASAGGYLVGTQHMPGSFIDLLRARLVAARAGVQVLPGLVGNVDIPKQTAASTGYWISTEGAAPTESQPSFGQVLLSPKHVGGYVDITRNLLKQATPAADAIVINDLVAVLARTIDLAVFHGSGTNGQPGGIPTAAGVGSFTAANITRALALAAIADVMNANADGGSLNWVTNPVGWSILKGRDQGSVGVAWLCDDGDRMLGYPVLHSTQISSGYLFFGDFSQVLVGEWGVVDINVDDKSLSTSSGLRIVAFQSVDVAVRHGGAFTVATDLS